MKNKIIIAGGTGFIGEALINHFAGTNEVVVLTRNSKNPANNSYRANGTRKQEVRYVVWDAASPGAWTKELEDAFLLINLCGKSVNCRYNEKNKKAILYSRVNSTTVLGEAIRQCANPPKVWINASSATIYRHATDRSQDEYTGEIKNDFSVQVCKAWEQALFDADTPRTRKVALRLAITLGHGGVMVPFTRLTQCYLGGPQGSGKQMFSWVHIDDVVQIISFIAEHRELAGAINCCSPHPIPNAEFMAAMRKQLKKSIGLPAPAWLLSIGAKIIGTETELLLKSRWVVPTRLLHAGYSFKFPDVQEAIHDLAGK